MQGFFRQNNGIKFLLLVVEVLSNYIWVRPLKRKKAYDVGTAFEYLIINGDMSEPPRRLQTDEVCMVFHCA